MAELKKTETNAKSHPLTVGLGDVVDQLHDEHGLANSSTTKEPNLSSPLVRCQQVDHLQMKLQMSACGRATGLCAACAP